MPKVMKYITAFSSLATVFSVILLHFSGKGIYLTLSVTFGTTTYHLGIRLLIGLLYNTGMKNQADYTKKRYHVYHWENEIYRFLKVKKWKGKLPTFNPTVFSNEKHSWDEIAQAMCQSELVHETNMIFSFAPLIASRWFGSFPVFLVTSICGAVFDLLFVMIQRYNRPRVVRIALKEKNVPEKSISNDSPAS